MMCAMWPYLSVFNEMSSVREWYSHHILKGLFAGDDKRLVSSQQSVVVSVGGEVGVGLVDAIITTCQLCHLSPRQWRC